MKFIAAATALFAGFAAAAPQDKQARSETVTLKFWAAADNTFSVDVPVDGSKVYINSDLSFSKIQSYSHSKSDTVCHAYGKDGSDTELHDSESRDIGPPQVQKYATCSYSY